MIIVLAELADGRLSRATLEAIAAARLVDFNITLVVAGATDADADAQLAQLPVTEVVRIADARLDIYTPGPIVDALSALIDDLVPSFVFCAHTYQARDYVPRLAARIDRPLLTDCIGVTRTGDTLLFQRPVFQGKVVASVALEGPPPHIVCVQVGAFRADSLPTTPTAPAIRVVQGRVSDQATHQIVEPPFRESRQDIDLTDASRIVAVGRGIKEESQLAIVRRLAEALGAELAASRPICDAGWMPMDRQIGSSGQTVAPELYVAVGISGAIQHIVGMKGARTIVAINKDADAPIFEIADYGIVGDLFDVVPAIVAALDAR